MVGFTTYGYRTQSESSIDNEVPLYLSGQNKQAVSRVAPGVADGGLDVYADEVRQEHSGGKIARFGYGPIGSPTWVFTLTSAGASFSGAVTLADVTITNGTFSGDVFRNGLILRPEEFDAAGDFQHFAAGVGILAGATALTILTAPATPIAVGMTVAVQGADSGGTHRVHKTTIATVIDTTHFTLAAAIPWTIPSPVIDVGTLNTTFLNNFFTAVKATGGTGELHGVYMAGNLNWTGGHGVKIRGPGFPGFVASGEYRGAALMPEPNLTGKWVDISAGSGVTLEGFGVGRSDQYLWGATPDVAIYASSAQGVETTNYLLRDLYVSGTFGVSSCYFNQMFEVVLDRCFIYNYHTGTGRCLVATANNRDNLTSAFVTQHSTSAFISSGQLRARACQFNQVGWSLAGYARTDFCVDLDGWIDAEFDGCLWTGANRAIRIRDEDTTAGRLTRTLTFINPTAENPGQSGALAMRGFIYLDANVVTENAKITNPHFNLSDTVPINAAWIEDGAAAGTTTAIKDWTIEGVKSIAGTETAILINKTSAGAGNRIINSDIDLAGRPVTISGSADEMTQWRNEGTITPSGGGAENRGISYRPGGPYFRYGLALGPRGLLDPNGAQILATPTVASAVNNFQMSPAVAGSSPELSVVGSTADLDMRLTPKGTGKVRVTASGFQVDAGGAAVTGALSSTAGVSGTTGTFSGAVSVASLASSGAVSGTTGTFTGAFTITSSGQQRFLLDANGNLALGKGGIGAADTNGDLYIPAGAATPTADVTDIAGFVALRWDGSTNQLCINIGGTTWRKSAAFT